MGSREILGDMKIHWLIYDQITFTEFNAHRDSLSFVPFLDLVHPGGFQRICFNVTSSHFKTKLAFISANNKSPLAADQSSFHTTITMQDLSVFVLFLTFFMLSE